MSAATQRQTGLVSLKPPGDYNLAALHTMIDQVIAWSAALAPLRAAAAAA